MKQVGRGYLAGLQWMQVFREQLEFRGKSNEEEVTISSNSIDVREYPHEGRQLTDDGLVKHNDRTAAGRPAYQETAKPLPELLAYAAQFQTDRGMTDYLKRVLPALPEKDREAVEELLKLPAAEIREEICGMAKAE